MKMAAETNFLVFSLKMTLMTSYMAKYLKYIISKMDNINYFSQQIHIIEVDRSQFYGGKAFRVAAETYFFDIFIKNDTDDVINVKISQICHLQNG